MGTKISGIQIPDRGCKWIHGEVGKDGHYCGHPIHRRSFCLYHFQEAYQEPALSSREQKKLLRLSAA